MARQLIAIERASGPRGVHSDPLKAPKNRARLHREVEHDAMSSSASNSLSVDVAIIGGGINGVGIARDLSKRGVTVYLAEKHDFAFGATGHSSGMIHGGLRYLLNEPKVTGMSCRDSGYIQNIAKNAIFRLPFLLPVYNDRAFAKQYLYLSDVFFSLYDRYQPLKNGRDHGKLTREETIALEPGLQRDKLIGAVTTDEWGIDAHRLTVLNALDARAYGAVLQNHAEVVALRRSESGQATGIDVVVNGARRTVNAKVVVNCSGAWNPSMKKLLFSEAKVRPGKGIHLVFDARISDFAIITKAIDGRQVFMMPHQNETWFGNTDDDFFGDADDPGVTKDEVEYLFSAAEKVFPQIRKYRCFSTMVGLRPSIAEWGKTEDDVVREHALIDHTDQGVAKLLSVIGGKLASYRLVSEEMTDKVLVALGWPSVPCRTHSDALPGHDTIAAADKLANEFSIDPVASNRLVQRHGHKARDILLLGRDSPSGYSMACPCEPTLECEVRHAVRHEWIAQPTDLVDRVRVCRGPCLGLRCAARVGQIYAEEKGKGAVAATEAALSLAQEAARRTLPVADGDVGLQLQRVERALLENGGALASGSSNG